MGHKTSKAFHFSAAREIDFSDPRPARSSSVAVQRQRRKANSFWPCKDDWKKKLKPCSPKLEKSFLFGTIKLEREEVTYSIAGFH